MNRFVSYADQIDENAEHVRVDGGCGMYVRASTARAIAERADERIRELERALSALDETAVRR